MALEPGCAWVLDACPEVGSGRERVVQQVLKGSGHLLQRSDCKQDRQGVAAHSAASSCRACLGLIQDLPMGLRSLALLDTQGAALVSRFHCVVAARHMGSAARAQGGLNVPPPGWLGCGDGSLERAGSCLGRSLRRCLRAEIPPLRQPWQTARALAPGPGAGSEPMARQQHLIVQPLTVSAGPCSLWLVSVGRSALGDQRWAVSAWRQRARAGTAGRPPAITWPCCHPCRTCA